jgi:hypothetical protein
VAVFIKPTHGKTAFASGSPTQIAAPWFNKPATKIKAIDHRRAACFLRMQHQVNLA